MAPVLETVDTWDANPALSSDTEFQLVAFAFGVGLGIAAVLVSNHVLRSFRSHGLFKPITLMLGISSESNESRWFELGWRIRPPLRI
jgi:hypothetical protein